ncbi:MAG: flagellar biosynthetic protein FliO [Clostridium sp.]
MDTFFMFIKLIFALTFVLLLMLLTLKMAGKGYGNINSNKHVKVVDRIQIGKDSFVTVLKVGERGYLLSNSPSKTEVLDRLPKEEIEAIEEEKKKAAENISGVYDKIIVGCKDGSQKILGRLNSKDEKNE